MSGSREESREGVRDVKVAGGTDWMLGWLNLHLLKIQAERKRIDVEAVQLHEAEHRVKELMLVVEAVSRGETVRIVGS